MATVRGIDTGRLLAAFVDSFKSHRQARLDADAAARAQALARKERHRRIDRQGWGARADSTIDTLGFMFVGFLIVSFLL
jgi:hypothetical protein